MIRHVRWFPPITRDGVQYVSGRCGRSMLVAYSNGSIWWLTAYWFAPNSQDMHECGAFQSLETAVREVTVAFQRGVEERMVGVPELPEPI